MSTYSPTTQQEQYPHHEKYDSILVLGWTSGKNQKPQMTSLWNKDNWLKVHVAKSKSFARCYETNAIPSNMLCDYTDNKSLYDDSSAILFRGQNLHALPMPEHRHEYQHWVFVEHEPPYKVWQQADLAKYNGVFNLTATYALDSDIPRLQFVQHCLRNFTKLKELQKQKYTKKKRSDILVAWLVSDCVTQSKREEYVRELTKHISVDIYGKCGDKKCGTRYTWSTDNCFQKLLHGNKSYKFYLAFENSLCEDYVTEKFWSMLNLDVIPVVMGAVDYANFMPKDSFIDVRDFDGPQALAEYLTYLDKHDNLYNQYIRNKNSLECEPAERSMPWECLLCKTLHELKGQRKTVHSLDSFWSSRRCIQPSHFRKKVALNEFFLNKKQ